MTACKDSLNGKKAVSATLAGVLAVGMVPAAAFAADQPTDEAEGQGIELQEKTPAQAFASGSFAFTDQAGNAVATTAKKDGSTAPKAIELAYTGENQYLVPSTVTIDGVAEPVDLTSGDYTVTYTKDGESTALNQYTIKESGTYKVTVAAKSTSPYYSASDNATATFYFKIGEAALEGVTLYEHIDGKDNDVSDTSFNFTGTAVDIRAAKDGAPLAGATVTFYNAADKTTVAANSLIHAGDYIANVKVSTGSAAQDVDIPFTINAVDLSKAAIVMGDVTTSGTAPQVTKAGSLNSTGLDLLRVVPEGTQDYTKPGTHKATVQLADAAGANKAYAKDIVNSAAVTYNVLSEELAATDFKYDNAAWPTDELHFAISGATTIGTTNYVKGSFDCDKIAVYKKGTGAASATTENKLTAGTDYTVTVADKDGNVVDAASTKTPGTWTVTVKALYTADDGKVYGGTETVDVEVINGQIGSTNVTATYKGKVVDGVVADYNGEDVAKDVAITVTSGTGAKKVTLVEGTDYKVTLTDSNSKEVAEAVDHDTYTLTVKGITYKGEDTVTITVNQATVTTVRPAGLTKVGNREFLAGDGSTLDPSYEFVSGTKDGKPVYSALPADAAKVTKIEYKAKSEDAYKEVKAIDKAGFYKVTFAHNNKDVKGNYVLTPKDNADAVTAEFEVNEGKYFTDVLPGDWFYNEVYKAKDKHYVHGIGDTKMYAPYDSMTRADVCMVLMRMAGGDPDFLGKGDDASYTDITYETGFNDVSSSAYYAKAVQWAAKAGIVKGYGDTGSFGPTDAVTREQFATMLSRYANASAGDASALSAYTDAAAVSDYAKGTIAWAVEKKIMGQNTTTLAPQKEVSRAEVAAMAVRLQPNGPVTL